MKKKQNMDCMRCKEGNDQIYLERKEKEKIERFLKSNM